MDNAQQFDQFRQLQDRSQLANQQLADTEKFNQVDDEDCTNNYQNQIQNRYEEGEDDQEEEKTNIYVQQEQDPKTNVYTVGNDKRQFSKQSQKFAVDELETQQPLEKIKVQQDQRERREYEEEDDKEIFLLSDVEFDWKASSQEFKKIMEEQFKKLKIGKMTFIEEKNKTKKTSISSVYKCKRYDTRQSALKFQTSLSDDPQKPPIFVNFRQEPYIWSELQKLHAYYGLVATATLHNHLYANDGNTAIILMEYLDSTLGQIIKNNYLYVLNQISKTQEHLEQPIIFLPLNPAIIVKIMRELLSSLFIMHLNSIYHLDIKPGNIMYHQDIDKFVFIDFGSAQMENNNDVFRFTTQTQTSNTTFVYCPKEHVFPTYDFRGEYNDVNPYALDVWACGIILFELVLIYLQIDSLKQHNERNEKDDYFFQKYQEFMYLRTQCSNSALEFRNSLDQKNAVSKGSKFYDFVNVESKKMFMNLNREDILADFDGKTSTKGLNHLALMLDLDQSKRINIFELAVDLNLPVLQRMIRPPPVKNLYRHMSQSQYDLMMSRSKGGTSPSKTEYQKDVIIYTNGCVYEGDVEKNQISKAVKRSGVGRLFIDNPFFWQGQPREKLVIYEGQWKDDQPLIQENGTYVRLPVKVRDQKNWRGYKTIKVRLRVSNDKEIYVDQLIADDNGQMVLVSQQSLQKKFGAVQQPLTSLNQKFTLKKWLGNGQYILEATKLSSLYDFNQREQRLSLQQLNRSPQEQMICQCISSDLLYGSKILQCINFQVIISLTQNQSFCVVQKLQSNHISSQNSFYQFLCLMTEKYHKSLKPSDIEAILHYLLFIIKYMNFTMRGQGRKINLQLEEFKFPIQNLNDSQMVNFYNCFEKSHQISEINFSQSNLISDISTRYLLNYFQITNLRILILLGTSISDQFINELISIFKDQNELEEVDFSFCQKLSDKGISDFTSIKLLKLKKFRAHYTNFGKLSFKAFWTQPHFLNLAELEIQGCTNQFQWNQLLVVIAIQTALKSLEYLNIQDCPWVDLIAINKILKLRETQLPHLSRLNLSCNYHRETEILTQGLKKNPLKFLDISYTLFTDIDKISHLLTNQSTEFYYRGVQFSGQDNVEQMVLQSQSVKHLDFCCLDFNMEQILSSGVFERAMDIQQLSIINCQKIEKSFLLLILDLNLQYLTDLDLTASECDNEALQVLANNQRIRKLQSLNLSKCEGLTDELIDIIGQSHFIQQLETLDLSFTNISNEGLLKFAKQEPWKNFQNLILKMCQNIKDTKNSGAVDTILSTPWLATKLKVLDLSHIKEIRSQTLDACINQHIQHNPQVNQLINLHCCPALYKPQPLPIVLKDYEKPAYQFRKITKETLLSLCECPQTSILLPNIRLDNLSELSDPVFTQILQSKSFKEKTEKQMRDSKFGDEFLLIESIDLSFSSIGAMSIRLMADQESISQNLRVLNLAGCNLGQIAIGRLIRHGFPLLQMLDISQTKVSDEVFLHFKLKIEQNKLPALGQLKVEWCDLITQSGIIAFKRYNHKQIQALELNCQPHNIS